VKVDPKLWTLEHLCNRNEAHIHHSFQTFTEENGSTSEKALVGMSFREHRTRVKNGGEKIYMTDLGIKLMPNLERNFDEAMMRPRRMMMIAGPHCLMKHVSDSVLFLRQIQLIVSLIDFSALLDNQIPSDCRSDYGPNLHMTPRGNFTQLHQDGNGTVDSGHCCHKGFNEVIMLKRGSEQQMKNMEAILAPTKECDGTHAHGDGKKPSWPAMKQVEQCEDLG
jgi:hypothetical protein